MAKTWLVCVAIGLVVALLVVLIIRSERAKKKESFKLLGTLAPYADTYYHCLSECERADPAKQMTPGKGSLACAEYCDSTITDWSRRGGPSYPSDSKVAIPVFDTPIDLSYKICGDGSHAAWCRDLYTTSYEIDEKCRQNCAYSPLPEGECVSLCAKSLVANKSRGWTWK
jgi:hypothetical protein